VGEREQVAVAIALAYYVGPHRHAAGPLNTGMEIAGTCMVVQISASFALPVVLRPTGASPSSRLSRNVERRHDRAIA
jgi:hypothetical protein